MTIKNVKRLIADDGKLITNGKTTGKVVDVATWIESYKDFYEIDDPDYMAEEENEDDE